VVIDDEEDDEVKSFDESLRLVLEDIASHDDIIEKFNMLKLKFVEQVREKNCETTYLQEATCGIMVSAYG